MGKMMLSNLISSPSKIVDGSEAGSPMHKRRSRDQSGMKDP